jgi:hypothetical protein
VPVDVPDAEGALDEIVIAGYRLRSLIAADAGGARIYAATEEETGLAATVRLAPATDAAAGRRFAADAEALGGLHTAPVPKVLAHGEAPEGLYVVTEEVVGRELASIIGPGGLSPLRAVKLLGDVADALDRAHAVGLLHRAVRPSTMIVESHPVERAILTSFEIGRERDATEVTGEQAPYASPEEARGERATAASDVYSFACVLYECVTGEPPFGRAADAALEGHTSGMLPAAEADRRTIPPGLGAALTRGLAQDPAARPASAGDLIAESARAAFEMSPPAAAPARDPHDRPAEDAEGPDAAGDQPPVLVAGTPVRRGASVPAWAVVLLLLAATAGGWLAARAVDDDGPPRAAAGGVDVVIPAGWSAAEQPDLITGLNVTAPAVLTPGPTSPTGLIAGMVPGQRVLIDPRRLAAAIQAKPPKPEAVRLGDLRAWRWTGLKARNPARVVTLYAVPTSAGTAIVACYGPRGANTPPTACSEAAASLRIRGEQAYDPALGAAWRGNIRSATATLARRRAPARSLLARAQRVSTRATAARRLAAAHSSALAAIDFRGVPPQAADPHAAISAQLRALASDYRRLAQAAGRPTGRAYRNAQRAIARDDAQLRAALRGI